MSVSLEMAAAVQDALKSERGLNLSEMGCREFLALFREVLAEIERRLK